jgi:hypothetical protein
MSRGIVTRKKSSKLLTMVWPRGARNAYRTLSSGHPGKPRRVEDYIKMNPRDKSCCDNRSTSSEPCPYARCRTNEIQTSVYDISECISGLVS